MNFEEPLTMSKGKQPDDCIVKILRPEMFKVEGGTETLRKAIVSSKFVPL